MYGDKNSAAPRILMGWTYAAALGVSCLAVTTGCKTSSLPTWTKPSFPDFGWKREPSPDTLAGVGPTATYPVSPSAATSPSPIESVAASPAGVKPQTGAVAGVSPAGRAAMGGGGVTTASGPSSANPAAAVANGFAGPRPSYATGQSAAAMPQGNPPPTGGFVYGQPANSSPSGSPTPSGLPNGISGGISGGSAPNLPNASSYAAIGYPLPGSQPGQAGVPANASSQGLPPGVGLSTPQGPSLPQGIASSTAAPASGVPSASVPTNSSPLPPKGNIVMPNSATPSGGKGPSGLAMPPAVSKPAAVTANAVGKSPDSTAAGSGYTPGSTMGATRYPATSNGIQPGDTFYR
jgi:hypothetical protein